MRDTYGSVRARAKFSANCRSHLTLKLIFFQKFFFAIVCKDLITLSLEVVIPYRLRQLQIIYSLMERTDIVL